MSRILVGSSPRSRIRPAGIVRSHSQPWDFLRRFRRNRSAVIGASILVFEVVLAVMAPLLTPQSPYAAVGAPLAPPGTPGHPFGTDDVGRDILTRVIYGARISLLIGIVVVLIALVFSVPLGLSAALLRPLDPFIMRTVDALLAFPGMLLALAVAAALGPSLGSLMIAVGISSVGPAVVVIRAAALTVISNEYVLAARASGATETRVAFRHVLPNIMAPIIVSLTFRMATAVLVSTSLSFLGLGPQPPLPEWGLMLSSGRGLIYLSPHVAAFPGLAIFITVLALNLTGDGIRDTLDPRLRE